MSQVVYNGTAVPTTDDVVIVVDVSAADDVAVLVALHIVDGAVIAVAVLADDDTKVRN
jgi:hypothetical protein